MQKELDRYKPQVSTLQNELEKAQALVSADKQELQDRIDGLHQVLAYLQIQSSAKAGFEIDADTAKLLDSLLPAVRDSLAGDEVATGGEARCLHDTKVSDALQVCSRQHPSSNAVTCRRCQMRDSGLCPDFIITVASLPQRTLMLQCRQHVVLCMQAEREEHAAAMQKLRDEYASERCKLQQQLNQLQQSKHDTDEHTTKLHKDVIELRSQLAQAVSENEWLWSDKVKPLQVLPASVTQCCHTGHMPVRKSQ